MNYKPEHLITPTKGRLKTAPFWISEKLNEQIKELPDQPEV